MWPHRSTLLWLFENVSGGPAGTVLWQTHSIYIRPWLKAQMRRRCQKLGAKNAKNLPFLFLFMPLQPNGNTDWSTGIGQSQHHHIVVQTPGKLYFIYFIESAQVAVQWCCPIWWSSFQSLFRLQIWRILSRVSSYFAWRTNSSEIRGAGDKEDYYTVFALRADFVLFCLLCL